MYNNQSVSVVMPAYNEEDSITEVIKDFSKLGIIDEIIVIDNNSDDNTPKLAKKEGAIIIKEEFQGYGSACIRALKEASSDLIILVESDGTFESKDSLEMLKLIKDYDMIIGSRTIKYDKNANMNSLIKFGNNILGLLTKFLYGQRFNDLGCTYRIVKKEKLKLFLDKLNIKGAYFTPELTVKAINAGLKIKQIPVNYKKRLGETKLSMTKLDSIRIGLVHIWIIISCKFKK